jgi:hypothetical protein
MFRELLSRPLRYWLGWDEPFKYEVANGRVFMVSASSRREMFVLSEIQSWKRIDAKSIAVYQSDCTRIIGDHSNKLGSILEKELPECWIMDDEDDE